MVFETYHPGGEKNIAHTALCAMMQGVDEGKSYADMIRLRLSGRVADRCNDTYYVARQADSAYARLWNGWGKHPDAIGNWGNFYTVEVARGQGIGGQLLKLWQQDMEHRDDAPLCFLCSAGTKELTQLYAGFGFRPAIVGTEKGFLYRPNGDSPQNFRDFYTKYYGVSEVLYQRPANIEYRHEIDCLLRFAYKDLGLEFGIGEMQSVESALLYAPERTGMLFSKDGHCVGWTFDGIRQVYPMYGDTRVIVDEKMEKGMQV